VARPVCLVSGSSSGIGAAVVREFAARGHDVVVHYHTGAERATELAAALGRDFGIAPLVLGGDLARSAAAAELVDAAYAHFGRLDVLVSNSGVSSYVADASGRLARFRFYETPLDHLEREFARALELNLKGAYRLVQRGLARMLEQAAAERQRGAEPAHRSILFITSISDIAPDPTRVPYGVSKAGLSHVVLSAALEGGPQNITVNALRPGVVDTPMTRRPSGLRDPLDGHEYTVAEVYALMAAGGAQPIRRIAIPAEIAHAAYCFTQIPYMTGQLIAVDGGFTLASGFANRELFLREGQRRRAQI